MQQKSKPQEQTRLPLARVIALNELPGRLTKTLVVPPGRAGILLTPQGQARVLPPGKHTIASIGERVSGKAADLRVGYFTSTPFQATLNAAYLPSGDGALLDASLLAAVQVSDPARYFAEQVIPRVEIRAAVVDASDPAMQTALAAVARCYAAADLIQGLPTARLVEELRPGLGAALQNQGLELAAIQVITFWRSDERVTVAEKIRSIEDRLEALAVEKQMKAVETGQMLEDYSHQVQMELGESGGVRIVPPPAGKKDAVAGLSVAGIQGWFQSKKEPQTGRSHWPMVGLFKRTPAVPDAKEKGRPHRPPRRWWLPGAVWIFLLLAAGTALTRLFLTIDGRVSPEFLFGWIFSAWLVILPGLLEAVKRMVEKREKINQELWLLAGAARIDTLVDNDRPRADQLVREQCRVELQRSAELLDTLVNRTYTAGATEQALRLRKSRQRFSESSEKILRPDFGRPAYLSDLHFDGTAWDRLLDYDEDLLLYAGALADQVLQLQQKWVSGVQAEPELAAVEAHLDEWMYRFGGRARALRTA